MPSEVKKVVESLHNLAKVPENRSRIISDHTCIQCIVNSLENEDIEVCLLALEVLHLLSQRSEDQPRLAGIVGLVSSVKSIMLSHTVDPQCKKMASNVYASLQSHLEGVDTSFGRDVTNLPCVGNGLAFFSSQVTSCLSKSETITFYITNLNSEEARADIESKLLKIKGIVSFLLDIRTHRATIRSLISSKELHNNMKQNGILNAHLAQEGVEAIGKENEPQYLPDEVETPSEVNSWYNSIVSWGTSSVDERKESQRRSQKKKDFQNNRGFFNRLYSVGEALNIF